MKDEALKGKQKKEAEGYVENYREMLRRLGILSRLATRQMLSSRQYPDGDPRVEFVTVLEQFKNMHIAQISVLLRLATEKLGVTREEFLELSQEELVKQVMSMENELCIKGWDTAGNPMLDLAAYREKTRAWPQ